MDKLALIQHKQQLNQIAQMEQSVVRAVEQLVKYLDGKTTKTQVVNQLTQIGTPVSTPQDLCESEQSVLFG